VAKRKYAPKKSAARKSSTKTKAAPKKSPRVKKFPNVKNWNAVTIKRFREFLGMSRKEFASMLGFSEVAVWYWENGHAEPRPQTQSKLDKAYVKAEKKTTHTRKEA